MPGLKTTIDIDAAPEDVWAILADFDRYGEWNPFVRYVEGDTRVGNDIAVLLELPGGPSMEFRPEVLAKDEAREFRWIGRTKAAGIKLVDGEHYFQIDRTEDGSRLTHGEQFTGILASPMMWLIGGRTREGFELMNVALKERVEARVAQPGGDAR